MSLQETGRDVRIHDAAGDASHWKQGARVAFDQPIALLIGFTGEKLIEVTTSSRPRRAFEVAGLGE